MSKKLTVVINEEKERSIEALLQELQKTLLYKNNELEIFIISDTNKYKQCKYIKSTELIAKDYNKAVKKSTGEYIQFLSSVSYINSKDFDLAMKYLFNKKLDIICYTAKNIESKSKLIDKTNVIKKEELLLKFNPYFSCYIFKNSEIVFNEKYYDDSLNELLIRKLNKQKSLKILKQKLLYRETEDNFYKKTFYIDSANELIKNLSTINLNDFVQQAILYFLSIKFSNNMNASNKGVLNKQETNVFFEKVKLILDVISDKNILEMKNSANYLILKQIFFSIKYDQLKLDVNDYPVLLNKDNKVVDTLEEKSIDIIVLDYVFGKLNFDCEFIHSHFMEKGAKIVVDIDGHNVDIKENKVYSTTKVFNRPMHNKYTFNFSIKDSFLTNNSKITIKYIYLSYEMVLPISFKRVSSKLSNNFRFSFYRFNNKYIHYYNNSLRIKKNYHINTFFKELLLYFNFILKGKNKKYALESIVIRMVFWLTKFRYKKPIWISYDKLYKAGDNGEYFYHYVNNQKDGYRKYYIINKDCPDYKRLQNENILIYKSIKCFIYSLNCSIMFSSHANPYFFCGFTSGIAEYFKDLLTFKTACIQHGLSVNDVAKFQNRVYANTLIYYCASNFEIKNLHLPEYDYKGYDILKLTGLPRYDGLKNNDKKIILITPTWRHNSSSSNSKINEVRRYNDFFKHTEYFKIYNSLINDERLIEAVKGTSYKIIYLLHPAVSSQINDFKKNEYVDIIASTSDISYEKILTESSVMITDFSGVQFDFAYMRKPIIYYQPDELPPHYEEKGLIYDKEGFGPVCKTKQETVDEVIKLIKNDFKADKKYIKRANNFFEFDDFNNCKRMYKVALDYQKKLLKQKQNMKGKKI